MDSLDVELIDADFLADELFAFDAYTLASPSADAYLFNNVSPEPDHAHEHAMPPVITMPSPGSVSRAVRSAQHGDPDNFNDCQYLVHSPIGPHWPAFGGSRFEVPTELPTEDFIFPETEKVKGCSTGVNGAAPGECNVTLSQKERTVASDTLIQQSTPRNCRNGKGRPDWLLSDNPEYELGSINAKKRKYDDSVGDASSVAGESRQDEIEELRSSMSCKMKERNVPVEAVPIFKKRRVLSPFAVRSVQQSAPTKGSNADGKGQLLLNKKLLSTPFSEKRNSTENGVVGKVRPTAPQLANLGSRLQSAIVAALQLTGWRHNDL